MTLHTWRAQMAGRMGEDRIDVQDSRRIRQRLRRRSDRCGQLEKRILWRDMASGARASTPLEAHLFRAGRFDGFDRVTRFAAKAARNRRIMRLDQQLVFVMVEG